MQNLEHISQFLGVLESNKDLQRVINIIDPNLRDKILGCAGRANILVNFLILENYEENSEMIHRLKNFQDHLPNSELSEVIALYESFFILLQTEIFSLPKTFKTQKNKIRGDILITLQNLDRSILSKFMDFCENYTTLILKVAKYLHENVFNYSMKRKLVIALTLKNISLEAIDANEPSPPQQNAVHVQPQLVLSQQIDNKISNLNQVNYHHSGNMNQQNIQQQQRYNDNKPNLNQNIDNYSMCEENEQIFYNGGYNQSQNFIDKAGYDEQNSSYANYEERKTPKKQQEYYRESHQLNQLSQGYQGSQFMLSNQSHNNQQNLDNQLQNQANYQNQRSTEYEQNELQQQLKGMLNESMTGNFNSNPQSKNQVSQEQKQASNNNIKLRQSSDQQILSDLKEFAPIETKTLSSRSKEINDKFFDQGEKVSNEKQWKTYCQKMDKLLLQKAESLMITDQDKNQISKSFQKLQNLIFQFKNEITELRDKNVAVFLYGSSVNGLSLRGESDMDITILVNALYCNHKMILESLQKAIFVQDCYENCEIIEFSSGIMLKFYDTQYKLQVEIQINKLLELKNSQLIQAYSKLDKRFLKLAVLLKYWNRKHFPDAKCRLNSYSIVLMLLAMFQDSNILPKLQQLNSEKNCEVISVSKYNPKSQFQAKNPNSFGQSQNRGNLEFFTDIGFEKDQNIIEQFMIYKEKEVKLSKLTNQQFSLIELLLKFFEKYQINQQNPSTMFISVGCQNSTQTYLTKNQYMQEILQQFINEQDNQLLNNYLQTTLLRDLDQYTYVIVDPFDKTYNPAKALKKNYQVNIKFQSMMKSTSKNLLELESIKDF
eukprot:403367885